MVKCVKCGVRQGSTVPAAFCPGGMGRQAHDFNEVRVAGSNLNWKPSGMPRPYGPWAICCRTENPCKEHTMDDAKVEILLQLNKKLDEKHAARSKEYAAYGEAQYHMRHGQSTTAKLALTGLNAVITELETTISQVKAL